MAHSHTNIGPVSKCAVIHMGGVTAWIITCDLELRHDIVGGECMMDPSYKPAVPPEPMGFSGVGKRWNGGRRRNPGA